MTPGGPLHYAAHEFKKDTGLLEAALRVARQRQRHPQGGEAMDVAGAEVVQGATRLNGGYSATAMQSELMQHWAMSIDASNSGLIHDSL